MPARDAVSVGSSPPGSRKPRCTDGQSEAGANAHYHFSVSRETNRVAPTGAVIAAAASGLDRRHERGVLVVGQILDHQVIDRVQNRSRSQLGRRQVGRQRTKPSRQLAELVAIPSHRGIVELHASRSNPTLRRCRRPPHVACPYAPTPSGPEHVSRSIRRARLGDRRSTG